MVGGGRPNAERDKKRGRQPSHTKHVIAWEPSPGRPPPHSTVQVRSFPDRHGSDAPRWRMQQQKKGGIAVTTLLSSMVAQAQSTHTHRERRRKSHLRTKSKGRCLGVTHRSIVCARNDDMPETARNTARKRKAQEGRSTLKRIISVRARHHSTAPPPHTHTHKSIPCKGQTKFWGEGGGGPLPTPFLFLFCLSASCLRLRRPIKTERWQDSAAPSHTPDSRTKHWD